MTQLKEQTSEVSPQTSEAKWGAGRTFVPSHTNNQPSTTLNIALLTGGGDKPYALGMAAALTSVGIHVDFIGSDDLSVPELLGNPRVKFLNLRGDQRPEV